jgi:hypothetical protein
VKGAGSMGISVCGLGIQIKLNREAVFSLPFGPGPLPSKRERRYAFLADRQLSQVCSSASIAIAAPSYLRPVPLPYGEAAPKCRPGDRLIFSPFPMSR